MSFDLDAAIDTVAKRLTEVEHDRHFATRIAMSLPERASWPFAWWAPRLAMIAIVVVAGVLWAARDADAPPVVLAGVPTEVPPSVPTEVLANVPAIAVSAENHLANDRETALSNARTNDRENLRDFEHSLPSIEAVAALELEAIGPESLPEDASLTLAPLAIADLPTAEPHSPR